MRYERSREEREVSRPGRRRRSRIREMKEVPNKTDKDGRAGRNEDKISRALAVISHNRMVVYVEYDTACSGQSHAGKFSGLLRRSFPAKHGESSPVSWGR